MKVKKHLIININLAIPRAWLAIRPLSTLFVFLLVSCFPADTVPWKETTTRITFADWCLNDNLSVKTKHTVNVLLQVAETHDCNQASSFLETCTELYLQGKQITDLNPLSALTNLTKLYLYSNQIADIKPLSTLTNLTELYLQNNQIADIKPLSTLTNLTILTLQNNQIADIKPLSTLTNLTELNLYNNQITDIKPLSTLTNLTALRLGNNQALTDKTCPIQPDSIFRF